MLLGALISVAISWSQMQDVWATGAFFDTDDATRMVQVRDWMAGQGWYDLHMQRLGFAGAAPMHWTRIVDVPVALLIKLASLVFDAETAERAARIAFPLLLSIGALTLCALIAVELLGGASVLVACLLASLSGLSLLQFQPGRIDHHAPQILLFLASGLFTLRALDEKRARANGFLAALCLAASMAISLENLPVGCTIAACFVLLWASYGKQRSAGLNGFGWGLTLATPLLYVATMAPARWLAVACDAQSCLHVTLAMMGGAACIGLSATNPARLGARSRWLFALAAGGLIAALMRVSFPQCGLDPFGGVDPLVRREWLDKVTEALSLAQAWSHGMTHFILVNYAPAVAGLVGLTVAIWRIGGEERLRWMVWLALSLSAFLVASFRIGYVQTLQLATCFGVAFLMSRLPGAWRALRIPGAFATSVFALALVVPVEKTAVAQGKPAPQCTRPQDAVELTRLPPGLVLAPIDEGAYLLAFTKHRIVAAPYHRNTEGNRLEAQAFALPADEGLQMLKTHGVDYIAICGGRRRTSPLITALINGTRGAEQLSTDGNYQIWRILR